MKAKKFLALAALLSMACPSCLAQTETPENGVIDVIMARRAVRQYKDTPVEHDKLEAVVRCGINAPSGMNRQPWIIRVVESQDFISETTEIFKKGNPEMVERDPNFKNMYRNAPNIICVASPKDGSGNVDAGLLGENMMIAAQSLGLGTCCLGGPAHSLNANEDLRPYYDKLNIPDDYELNYILAIGYPDESPEAKPRDESKVEYIK